jgi:very-short-patch-repair endonuclease
MRRILEKNKSTKSERIFHECLKELHIPFKHRWIIQGRETDFVVGSYAIEIDGHDQDTTKNEVLVTLGYIPIHLHNTEVTRQNIINLLNKIK